MFGYQTAEDLMMGAKEAVARESTSLPHRIASQKYKLRKEFRNLPVTAVQRGISLIPLGEVTGLIGMGVDKMVEKIKARRAQAKMHQANADAGREDADLEDLRSKAKQDAKALVKFATDLEANQVKLKDASKEATRKVETVLFNTETYQTPSGQQCWDAACNIYERRRRKDKILDMVDMITGYLEGVKVYLDGVEKSCAEHEQALTARLDEWQDEIETGERNNLQVTGNGYAKLPGSK